MPIHHFVTSTVNCVWDSSRQLTSLLRASRKARFDHCTTWTLLILCLLLIELTLTSSTNLTLILAVFGVNFILWRLQRLFSLLTLSMYRLFGFSMHILRSIIARLIHFLIQVVLVTTSALFSTTDILLTFHILLLILQIFVILPHIFLQFCRVILHFFTYLMMIETNNICGFFL